MSTYSLKQLSLYDKSISSYLSILMISMIIISASFILFLSFRCVIDNFIRNIDPNQYENIPNLMEPHDGDL